MKHFDLVIIGGGINGAACAAEAAMRGLSVLLCEKHDLAAKTSSSSSKLIHGGLRYLESYNFSLVKKSLDEQQVLLSIAPHTVHKLPIVLPHTPKHRPMWLLRLGLFIYDHLSRINTLPNCKKISRRSNNNYFSPLLQKIKQGLLFYDCTADDARLTILNALQAKQHNAEIHTYTELTQAKNTNQQWQLTLKPQNGDEFQISCRALINASGPWLEELSKIINQPLQYALRLVNGSHIVVPRLYSGEHAYILQNSDNRIIFVIPFHGFSMIGTTEVECKAPIVDLLIEKAEIDYLCDIIAQYFKKSISIDDLIYTWSGVRPLFEHENQNMSQLSREHIIDYASNPAPLITIYGGKITTHRELAREAIQKLQSIFPHMQPHKVLPLPGATLDNITFQDYLKIAHNKYSWLDDQILQHYIEVYGTLTEKILKNCTRMSDLGIKFSSILYQCEVDYLINEEWAITLDDVLWRRTKLGLITTTDEQAKLQQYIKDVSCNITSY